MNKTMTVIRVLVTAITFITLTAVIITPSTALALDGKVPLANNNALAGKQEPQLFSPHLSQFLGAKWWQWALEIPAPINPLIDANPCNVNQHGYFFFLAGVFVPAPTTATSSGTSESSDIFQ